MEKLNKQEDKQRYVCPECGMHYESEEIMKKCEAWCAEYKSCNLDITKHSIQSQQAKQ